MAEKFPPLILELTDRRPSDFIMSGTENSANPDHLDCPSEMTLIPESVVLIDGERQLTRYIKGCDEYLVSKQDKFKPNPKEDIISFEFGRLIVVREHPYVGLYDFMLNHEGNRSLGEKNGSKHRRPKNAVDTFYQINTSAEAENSLDDLEDRTKALNIVAALREEIPGGDFKYNNERIVYLCKLFNIANLGTDPENMLVLRLTAEHNPKYFLDIIAENTADLRYEVSQARELGVISTEGDEASFMDSGRMFYKFKAKKDLAKRIAELVDYFNSKDAATNLSELRTKVKAKVEAELELK